MASRGPFGFRAKATDKEKGGSTAGLSRQPSITSTAARPSRLPTQSSSFFSRNKQPKLRAETTVGATPPASNIPVGRGQNLVNITATNALATQTRQEPSKSTGLGISMENKTAQVSKAGKTRNVLRRKAPTIDSRSGFARTESSAASYDPPPLIQHRRLRYGPILSLTKSWVLQRRPHQPLRLLLDQQVWDPVSNSTLRALAWRDTIAGRHLLLPLIPAPYLGALDICKIAVLRPAHPIRLPALAIPLRQLP